MASTTPEILSTEFQLETIKDPAKISNELIEAYASVFWADQWRELLTGTNSKGEPSQYGTNDSMAQQLAQMNGIDTYDPNWPTKLWQLLIDTNPDREPIVKIEGETFEVYWTFEDAKKTLQEYVTPISKGGYGGEIIILRTPDESIAGFTAYTVCTAEEAKELIPKRFGGKVFLEGEKDAIYVKNLTPTILEDTGITQVGLFLDLAVAPEYQGIGIGGYIFDKRLERILALSKSLDEKGNLIIVGRTLETQKAQFEGNYKARGLEPVARYIDNPNEVLCVASIEDVSKSLFDKPWRFF